MSLTIRKTLAAVAFAAILIGGFQPFYFRIFLEDRARLATSFAELPYRKLPGFRLLLLEVRDRTPVGSRVALWLPREWLRGYSYAYLRAVYLLVGRDVVPLLGDHDEPLPANLRTADYLVAWRGAPQVAGFAPVWEGSGGVLYRRTK